jgi:hypothetical protein
MLWEILKNGVGDHRNAAGYLTQALRIRDGISPTTVAVARVLYSLGNAQLDGDEEGPAIANFKRAVDIFDKEKSFSSSFACPEPA